MLGWIKLVKTCHLTYYAVSTHKHDATKDRSRSSLIYIHIHAMIYNSTNSNPFKSYFDDCIQSSPFILYEYIYINDIHLHLLLQFIKSYGSYLSTTHKDK